MSCLAVAAATAAGAISAPTFAQVAIEGALLSDYRVRGYSVSDGDPAASLSLSYDDPSGFYVGATAVGAARKFGATSLRLDLSGRSQARATHATALVVGVTHGF